ncbi:MAG: hypothetical protein ACREDY_00180, partial [Bradyrhizobium sp.]
VIEGSRLEVFGEDGALLAAFDAPAGGVFPLALEGDKLVSPLGGEPTPATHSARNAGATRYRELLVETKRR